MADTATSEPLEGSEHVDATTADSEAPQKKTKKIIRRKKRPARPQVDPSTLKSEPPQQTGKTEMFYFPIL